MKTLPEPTPGSLYGPSRDLCPRLAGGGMEQAPEEEGGYEGEGADKLFSRVPEGTL